MSWKKRIGISAAVLGTVFAVTSIVGKKKQGESRYDNSPEEKNPMQGKKVVFVESENDAVNADGIKGHLESIGESSHKAGLYEKYVKRGMDIVLSFGGLVAIAI